MTNEEMFTAIALILGPVPDTANTQYAGRFMDLAREMRVVERQPLPLIDWWSEYVQWQLTHELSQRT